MLSIDLKGNLGNHLFQLWSLAGMAVKYGHTAVFPQHPIYSRLKNGMCKITSNSDMLNYEMGDITKEKEFTHHTWPFASGKDYMIDGYLQSEKYWSGIENNLRSTFEFKSEFIKDCFAKLHYFNRDRYIETWEQRKTLCISIRRGDFVGNKTYYQLPITYYIGALFKEFPNWRDYNLLFLSDDIEYCRVHFECLDNAYFAEGLDAYEQLCVGSMCDDFIISNSTFSWWCAYLANRGKVVRPLYNFGDDYRKLNPEHDFWPARDNWVVFDNTDYKIPLPDVTFMIPVYYDHPDRKENLSLSVCMLQRDFDLQKEQVIVMENDSYKLNAHEQWARYVHTKHRWFHRTKMLNDMAKMAETSIVVNWDADVFIAPMQIWGACEQIRQGVLDFAYPYDGRFARVVRKDGLESNWYKSLCKHLDVGIFRNITHFGKKGKEMASTSVGGAVIMNRQAFIDSGMENENMISYAPEDCERWDRWHMLEYRVARIKGKLYHMDHFCGATSSSKNPLFDANHAELNKIRAMSKEELREYISSWTWAKNILPV